VCGRFTLTNPSPRRLADRFGLDLDAGFEFDERPRFNIAPTDPVLAIRRAAPSGAETVARNEPGTLRWGLLRNEEDRKRRPLINVRAESIANGSFREAFESRRCLIPADGFYEWRQDPEGKRPIWFSRPRRELFAFAGIWNEGGADGVPEPSCALITCSANEMMEPIHDRMPVILSWEAEESWLERGSAIDELIALLAPPAADALEAREVGDAVNDSRNDGPGLLDPPMRLF
jgi:putative SOS response-associated peptidase YedK